MKTPSLRQIGKGALLTAFAATGLYALTPDPHNHCTSSGKISYCENDKTGVISYSDGIMTSVTQGNAQDIAARHNRLETSAPL